MSFLPESSRRLYSRGKEAYGLVVDVEGVMLGPYCPLIQKDASGYRAISASQTARLLQFVFDHESGSKQFSRQLSGIAKALGAGDLLKAKLLGLQVPLGRLDPRHFRRLDLFSSLAKDDNNYNPEEARDQDGKWTAGAASGAAAKPPSSERKADVPGDAASPIAAGTMASAETMTGLAAWDVGSEALEALAQTIAAPVAVIGGLLLPSNRSHVSEGNVSGEDGLSYRYDEGELTLFRTASDSTRHLVFNGRADADDIYRDESGTEIGRDLHGSFILGVAAAPTTVAEATRDKPKICPALTPDVNHGASVRSWAYQTQVTGLLPFVGVTLNDVTFDGCRESDGTMLEAKGEGGEWMIASKYEEKKEAYIAGILYQAERQSVAAGLRMVEWHFASKVWADIFEERFNFPNVKVIYDPYIPVNVKTWMDDVFNDENLKKLWKLFQMRKSKVF